MYLADTWESKCAMPPTSHSAWSKLTPTALCTMGCESSAPEGASPSAAATRIVRTSRPMKSLPERGGSKNDQAGGVRTEERAGDADRTQASAIASHERRADTTTGRARKVVVQSAP